MWNVHHEHIMHFTAPLNVLQILKPNRQLFSMIVDKNTTVGCHLTTQGLVVTKVVVKIPLFWYQDSHKPYSKMASILIFLCLHCLSFGNMLKTPYVKLLQTINTHYLHTCVTMLYSAIKVQVDMINTLRCR